MKAPAEELRLDLEEEAPVAPREEPRSQGAIPAAGPGNGTAVPCERCGRFAFPRRTRCYWCRRSPAGETKT